MYPIEEKKKKKEDKNRHFSEYIKFSELKKTSSHPVGA